MPFSAIQEYDASTAANNIDIGGTNIAENAPFSGVNNALRELCLQVRRAVANQGSDIASASTTDIGASTGQYVKVTGTTTITSFGTVNAGTMRWVEFSGALTLTHSGTALKLPGSASLTTAAGDVGCFVSLGSGNWKCLHYERASGLPVAALGTSNISNDAVTYAKIQNVSAASRLLGRGSASGAGDPQELTVGSGLEISGTALGMVGGVIQTITDRYTTHTDHTDPIPDDNSIPQNTEGTQIISRAFTPTNASSTIRIRVSMFGGCSASNVKATAAIFKDSGASAIAACSQGAAGTAVTIAYAFEYTEASGSTTARTYSLRVGPDAGTFYSNGLSGGRMYGGVAGITMTIEEYL